ncbi:glycosyltransferase family 4 protein [Flavihumibacter petaseus]|uniref:Putative glycosyltransferase n=1 Tax=Flavihumibacter petaseus NBRC 106054 TaxID=1220578 RepID=A0A0E9N3B6_9BACT|nr:glycosyltransferase [Flavihumibacter petaseus]GAO44324.1 putative glycosyltransferase [Flavihumibacter petaseus NBRC 106054]
MVVLYYAGASYLDSAIEVINQIKHEVELHVVIEIAPESKTTNILDVKSLEGLPVLAKPEEVLDEVTLRFFQPYWEGAASVRFFVQQHPRTFSWQSWKDCQVLARHMKKTGAQLIHFDTVKARALGLLPFLYRHYRKKIAITIHDPAPHSGEFNWRNVLVKKGFFPLAKVFLFYSRFSEKTFKEIFPNYSGKTGWMGMHPLSFYRKFCRDQAGEGETILFFGRISPYKGVDVFLKSIPIVLEKFPRQKFVIAGSKNAGYELSETDIAAAGEQLECRIKYISNEELAGLVEDAKLVVCPYLDATQSGVLLTSFVCYRGVIASDVGAFPEFIEEDRNGTLVKVNDPVALANSIIAALESGSYLNWSRYIRQEVDQQPWQRSRPHILGAYRSMAV